MTGKIYDDSIKAMIMEQNTALSLGVDVKLVNHQEDEQDRQARGFLSRWKTNISVGDKDLKPGMRG